MSRHAKWVRAAILLDVIGRRTGVTASSCVLELGLAEAGKPAEGREGKGSDGARATRAGMRRVRRGTISSIAPRPTDRHFRSSAPISRYSPSSVLMFCHPSCALTSLRPARLCALLNLDRTGSEAHQTGLIDETPCYCECKARLLRTPLQLCLSREGAHCRSRVRERVSRSMTHASLARGLSLVVSILLVQALRLLWCQQSHLPPAS